MLIISTNRTAQCMSTNRSHNYNTGYLGRTYRTNLSDYAQSRMLGLIVDRTKIDQTGSTERGLCRREKKSYGVAIMTLLSLFILA